MMAGWWPTPEAAKQMPVVAERMNQLPKVVFSRTPQRVTWSNTQLLKRELAAEIWRLKQESGPDLLIMGSGSIVAQLTQEDLIDEFQIVLCPVVLGSGRTMFEAVQKKPNLKLRTTRAFANGNVFLRYAR